MMLLPYFSKNLRKTDVRILIFSGITIIFVFILFLFDSLWKRKHPKSYSFLNFGFDKKSWFNIYRFLLFAFLFTSYLYVSADLYGKLASKLIKEQSPITLKYSDNQTINGVLIGKIKDILFLKQNKKVIAIPITSLVKEFEIK